MSGFENYFEETRQLELAIERKGIALGIDWNDVAAVDALAQEAIGFNPGAQRLDSHDRQQFMRFELFGLSQLMLKVMTESASEAIMTHGGAAWKSFARALWRAHLRKSGMVGAAGADER